MAQDKKKRLYPKSDKARQEALNKPLQKFWVCDIESRDWTKLVMIGLTDGEQFHYFKKLAPFFDFLFEDKKDKTIFAHFGGKFDFLFLLDELFTRYRFRVEGMIPRGSGILCFDVIKEEKIDTPDGEQTREIKLTFRDSSAMLPFGLKRLTHNFKVESLKKEWDHSKTRGVTKELIKYCEYDCRGLHQVIQKYYSWPLVKEAGSSFTVAGQAMKVLQLFLEKPVEACPDDIDLFVRASYFGGRTEIFKPLFVSSGKERLYCADVNSLYPTVMRAHEYPNRFKEKTSKYKPDQIGFYDAEVEVPEGMYIPPLGTVVEIDKTKKFIFPTGRFKGRWSVAELEYARSLGVKIIKTGEGVLFENGGYLFRDYVDELYRIREESAKDSVDNIMAKLLLNSCYGRFGLNKTRENLIVDDGSSGLKPHMKIGEIDLVKEPKILETFTNVAVAAMVTSYARIFMHKYYTRLGDRIWYTDTDSLFTTEKFKDERGLGALKIEYEARRACFLLPKTYLISGAKGIGKGKRKKVTMKGFDGKKIRNFTLDDFMTALEGDLRLMRVSQDPKMATFKTALSKKKLLTMLPKSEKAIRSMYDKREVIRLADGDYDTRPLHIKNGVIVNHPKKKG